VSEDLESAKRFRQRAKQVRTIAEGTTGEVRRALLEIAKDYEAMAIARERIVRQQQPEGPN
jgi:hypothetical protein